MSKQIDPVENDQSETRILVTLPTAVVRWLEERGEDNVASIASTVLFEAMSKDYLAGQYAYELLCKPLHGAPKMWGDLSHEAQAHWREMARDPSFKHRVINPAERG